MKDPISITIGEFCAQVGLRRTTAFRLLREGKIESRLVGRRRLILMSSVKKLLDLPESAQEES